MNCVHCDITFESSNSEHPRCPGCARARAGKSSRAGRKTAARLRQAGVVRSPALRVVLIIALALTAGLVGYYFMGEPGEGGAAPGEETPAQP